MPQAIKIWEIRDDNTLTALPLSKVDREQQLEDWLADDIGIISDDFLVIGRQVRTAYDGYIDLLCLDSRGDLVVIELKRGKTPREVTAQSLDYASWVKGLSNDAVAEIAEQYLKDRGPLEAAFRLKFGAELPDILNEGHKIVIVAEEMDESTERIVQYLSDAGIGINVATIQYFQSNDGREMLAQVFLIEPAKAAAKTQSALKRRPYLSYDQLDEIARQNGVVELYDSLVRGLEGIFDQRGTTTSTLGFRGKFGSSVKIIFSLIPGSSDNERGLHFQIYAHRLATYLSIDLELVCAVLPNDHGPWTYWPNHPPDTPQEAVDDASGYSGYFANMSEVRSFVDSLQQFKRRNVAS